MRINSIKHVFTNNQYFNNSVVRNNFQNNPVFKGGLQSDVFIAQSPFNNFENFTIEEYKKLSPERIDSINEYIDERFSSSFDTTLKYHDLTAEQIKKTLDKNYGSNNYIVIPVGRSVSSIGKCLGYKIGEGNVKMFPMSKASRFINIEHCNEDFDALKTYLDSIGLSQKEIETSGKTYIFTDFCDRGASMLGVKQLFDKKIWGPHDNVQFVNILHLLDEADIRNINDDFDTTFFRNELNDMLYSCNFKLYSFVKPCKKLSDTGLSIVDTKNCPELVKSFWFKLLDNEMQKH